MGSYSDVQDWNHGDVSGLVSIGTHSLWASVSGPERKLHKTKDGKEALEPLIIILCGLGATAIQMVAVQRSISSFARVMRYDRSGLGKSEERPPIEAVESDTSEAVAKDTNLPKEEKTEAKELSTEEANKEIEDDTSKEEGDDDEPARLAETASQAAHDLLNLLQAMSIEGPFILIAHSYGGIISREFLHLVASNPAAQVAGLVFLDTPTERSKDDLQFPQEEVGAIGGDIDVFTTMGTTKEETPLSEEEWAEVEVESSSKKSQTATGREFTYFPPSCDELALKRQCETGFFGDRPLSLIRCDLVFELRNIYDAGVAKGNGTEEQQKRLLAALDGMSERDETLKLNLLKLSTKTRYKFLPGIGHNIHLRTIDPIVEEVKWVLENVE